MIATSLRRRFPGLVDDWARFDGPAGTQMVDAAVDAMAQWASSGRNANRGGGFPGADACDDLMIRARTTVAQLLGADAMMIAFGANMTTMTLAFTRAVAATLRQGDRVVGTRLDHDANVTPWRLACDQAGAEHVLAPFDAGTGELDPRAVIELIDERTRWVAVTAASNLLGTVPDLTSVVAAAHDAGSKVFVDAVHLTPHRHIDVAELGCDVLVTSPYKWYGPHAGVLCASPQLVDDLPIARVRPSGDHFPDCFETGTSNFEAIAGVDAAACFLLEQGMDEIRSAETTVFAPLLDGLESLPGVTVWGPSSTPPTTAGEHAPGRSLPGRTPTVSFTVEGRRPDEVAAALACERIAVWAGHSYAVEAVEHLGLSQRGGVVRAGVVRYIEPDDVARLLAAVERLM